MPSFIIWNCFPNNVWGLGLDQQNYMQVRVGATFVYATNNKLKLCSALAAKLGNGSDDDWCQVEKFPV